MEKISSDWTMFLKRKLPLFYFLLFIVLIVLLFLGVVNLRNFFIGVIVIIWFIIIWVIHLRTLNVVYIGDKYFLVNEERIFFKDVVSIEKHFRTSNYVVRYCETDIIKSFKFTLKHPFLITKPKYFKELLKKIEKEKQAK